VDGNEPGVVEVPVIDIASARVGGPVDEVAARIANAAESVGFFQIVGHGVSSRLTSEAIRASRELEACSQGYKDALASPTGHPFRGFSTVSDAAGRRLVDRFQVNWFDDAAAACSAGVDERYSDYFHPNVWPENVVGFEDTWRAYFQATQRLGDQLMRLFAYALHLENAEDRFDRSVLSPPVSALAVNLYPSRRESGTDPGSIIFRAHTDSGTLTLLYQEGDYAGLQVETLDGRWVMVPVVEGAYVVNLGELMARWTNGRWRATPHRVVAAQDPDAERVSLTTFHLPRVDVEIAPLAECLGEQGSSYGGVTPFEWEAIFLESYR
jgi:isopenicillin N synthase-like dioxygenase